MGAYNIQLPPSNTILDLSVKGATVIIAAANLFFAIRFFWLNRKKSDSDKESDRRILWLKTLILDHNLTHFYEFFDKIENSLSHLRTADLPLERLQEIESELQDSFTFLRRKFTDTLLSVDNSLYDRILECSDKLFEHLTKSIFDPGINLSHSPKFDEIITEKISSVKTDILRHLFSFKG